MAEMLSELPDESSAACSDYAGLQADDGGAAEVSGEGWDVAAADR